ERSLAVVGRWPWPRSVLADLVTRLSAAGAKVIAFDILLSEPQVSGEARAVDQLTERLGALGLSPLGGLGQSILRELDLVVKGSAHAGRLEAAMRESGRVVLPMGSEIAPPPPGVVPEPSGPPIKSALVSFVHYGERGVYPPPSASQAGVPIPRF